jgi:hypothetical protein
MAASSAANGVGSAGLLQSKLRERFLGARASRQLFSAVEQMIHSRALHVTSAFSVPADEQAGPLPLRHRGIDYMPGEVAGKHVHQKMKIAATDTSLLHQLMKPHRGA